MIECLCLLILASACVPMFLIMKAKTNVGEMGI